MHTSTKDHKKWKVLQVPAQQFLVIQHLVPIVHVERESTRDRENLDVQAKKDDYQQLFEEQFGQWINQEYKQKKSAREEEGKENPMHWGGNTDSVEQYHKGDKKKQQRYK